MVKTVSRRQLLWSSVAGVAALAGISGCRQAHAYSCDGATDLTVDDIKLRKTLEYVDRSADPEKTCERCKQFEPATSDGKCGGCKMMKGPIHPLGTCKVYALDA